MGANSKIEWCDHTFNGWIGCTKVSTSASGGGACDNCYAERDFDHRRHFVNWGVGETRHKTKTWGDPIRWNAKAAAFFAEHGHYPRVFAMSLADVFDNEVPDEWHAEFNAIVAATPNLRWMLTTKRLANIPKMTPDGFFRDNPHAGVIVSICNQPEASRDVPRLLDLKLSLGISWVGLSIEPMLGPIDLRRLDSGYSTNTDALDCIPDFGIDWVICGGESGPKARPLHADWARGLCDQCAAADIAFFFKQWGQWIDADHWLDLIESGPAKILYEGKLWRPERPLNFVDAAIVAEITGGWKVEHHEFSGHTMICIGKRRAGRLLDGREWNGVPKSIAGKVA